MPIRSLSFLSAIAAGVLVAMPASAQSTSDKAAAQALFDDAGKLAASNNWAAACPKYAESDRLDSGIRVKLYLADCYEHAGRTARAWEMFKEAEEYARKGGDNRASVAHQRADKLAPRLIQMVVVVPMPAGRSRREARRRGGGVGPVGNLGAGRSGHARDRRERAWQAAMDYDRGGEGGDRPACVEVPTLADAAPSVSSASTPAPPAPQVGSPEPGKHASASLRSLDRGRRRWDCHGLVPSLYSSQSPSSTIPTRGICHDGNLCDATGVQLRSEGKKQRARIDGLLRRGRSRTRWW